MRAEMRRTRRNRWPVAIAVAAMTPWACTDAGDVTLLEIDAAGVLTAQVFLDLDGTLTFTPADEPIANTTVLLLTGASSDRVDEFTTDTLGLFTVPDVPAGSYRLGFDPLVLGDSLEAIGPAVPITLMGGDSARLTLGATFVTLPLDSVLVSRVGRRVYTSGIALNTRVNFGDGQVHFRGDGTFLRTLNVERGALLPGDSAQLLGRVVLDNGRPALEDVTFSVLIGGAALVLPQDVSTAQAALADGGRLDAALVRIRNAEITDTSTNANGDFRFWADDGTDSVEFVVRDFLGVDTDVFRPDTIVRILEATGLLSPAEDSTGAVRWQFLPRLGLDITPQIKVADVSLTSTVDAATASVGDVVEFTVAVHNAGPRVATSVQIRDTIPTGVDLVSATATAGSFSQGTGLWDVGSLAAGAADTLRLQLEITAGAPAEVRNIAASVGLVFEVDVSLANDTTVVTLPIS